MEVLKLKKQQRPNSSADRSGEFWFGAPPGWGGWWPQALDGGGNSHGSFGLRLGFAWGNVRTVRRIIKVRYLQMNETSPLLLSPQNTWMQRNWKWFVPCICVASLASFAGFAVLIAMLVFGFMKSSDAYSGALARVRKDQQVIEELGTPIKEGWFVSGSINVSGASGEAELAIPIRGPKGKATVYVEAKKKMGQWHFYELVVEISGSRKRIDLSEKGPNKPDAPNPAIASLFQAGCQRCSVVDSCFYP